MTIKIKIKLGPIEVEYEGSEEFLKKELPQLLASVSNLHKDLGSPESGNIDTKREGGGRRLQATTSSIAAKLGCKTGPQLAMAAAAHLALVQRMNTFSRKELLDDMRSATAYYKATYNGNLSKYLHSLLKDGSLLEPSKNTYSLSADKRTELSKQLA